MKFLVIGGAGYIGSHFVMQSLAEGHDCVVYDNLSTGHRSAVGADVALIQADILDTESLRRTLRSEKPDAVLHFAALALVGESVEKPELYYQNNVVGVQSLLNAMRFEAPSCPLVFSSTCAVFGVPEKLPLSENDIKRPISPYGRSKLMAEFLIEDYARAYSMRAMALRYFNACGAAFDGSRGEDHNPETHLIPNVIQAGLQGKKLTLFGGDYPTLDGSCVRDYIHVIDLAKAHIKAVSYLEAASGGCFEAVHLGQGQGYTNLQVIERVGACLGKKIHYEVGAPRPGDPPSLYSSTEKALSLLGFRPSHSDLDTIIQSAVAWHQSHPQGYGVARVH